MAKRNYETWPCTAPGDGLGPCLSSPFPGEKRDLRLHLFPSLGSLSLSRAGTALQLGGRKAAQTRGASPRPGFCTKEPGAELRASRKTCSQLSSVGQVGPKPPTRRGMGCKCPFSSAAALQGQRRACKEPSTMHDSRASAMWAGWLLVSSMSCPCPGR